MATNERTEEQANIDTEAMRYRSRGYTYQQIADAMDCSKPTAYARVQRALAAIPAEAVEEYRRLEGDRLDTLLNIAMYEAQTRKSLYAIDRVLSIMERRAKLMGLDAPTKTEVISYDHITAEIMRLERELGVQDADDTGRAEEEAATGAQEV
jgi:orotate phosphoribosyltransferase-like protein